METFLSLLRRDFAGFEPMKVCEAALPIFDVKMTIKVLEKQPLSTFAHYFLLVMAHGKESLAEIAETLGVEARDLAGVGAQLLQLALIEQGLPDSEGKRRITLTDTGRKTLGERIAPPIPKSRTCYVQWNALTWTVMPVEEEAWSADQICKEGYFVLPVGEKDTPTLGDFPQKEVWNCVRLDQRFRQSELVALSKVEKVEPQYLAPVQVVLLQHQSTREQRVAAYSDRRQLVEEGMVLQRLFEERCFVFPAEATLFEGPVQSLPPIFSPMLRTTVDQFRQNEKQVQKLASQLDTEMQLQEQTQEEVESELTAERMRQLMEGLEKQRRELEQLRRQAAEESAEFLQTEQHRPILLQALREAREEIIIISPWMNPRTCNREVCQLLGKAIARGVHVRIAYGFGSAEDPRNAEWRRNNVGQVRRAFERAITQEKGQRRLLEMQETQGTHQKILICDRSFAVTGSFNWMSYAGKRDGQIREETSVLLRRREDVEKLAIIALRPFPF